MSHQQSSSQKSSSIWSFCLGILVVLVLINQIGFCAARYLPTRGDDTRKEMIKELLKELMDVPQTYENDNNRYANGKQPHYGLTFRNPETGYLNKRSVASDSQRLISHLKENF